MSTTTSEGHASAVRILRDVPPSLLNNVRKYPRSLSDAFPAERAAAIQIHRPAKEPLGWRVASWSCGVSSAALLAMHFAGWLP